MPLLRFNQLHPPFNNPAIRRAIMHAVSQSDYMMAVQGDNAALWHDGVGYFCPDTPMASSSGMENLTSKRDLGAARKELEAAGYHGERVVLLMPSDFPKFKALAEVTADLLQKLGFNVDVQSMDFGSMVKRRLMREPIEQGGWSIFASIPAGIEYLNPAVNNYLRGNGLTGIMGWPTSARIEALHDEWMATGDLAVQKQVAEQLQLQAFLDVPYIPLGRWFNPTAHRTDLSGMLTGSALFWNIRRG